MKTVSNEVWRDVEINIWESHLEVKHRTTILARSIPKNLSSVKSVLKDTVLDLAYQGTPVSKYGL